MSLTEAILLVVELIQAVSCGRIDEPESLFVDLKPVSTCEKQWKLPDISPLARSAGCSRRVLRPKYAFVWQEGLGETGTNTVDGGADESGSTG